MSQALQAADAFAYGSPAYGANVIGYLGARVAAGSFQAGRLHDGYGGAAVRGDDQADVTGNPSGFIRRQLFTAGVRVALTARKLSVTGVDANKQLKQHGVLARLTAGTLAGDGTSSVRLEACTCYALTMEWLAAGPAVRYRLKRFVAGVETVLATYDDTTAIPAIFSAEIRLSLVVTTNGSGDVELAGYVANSSLGLSTGGPGLPSGGVPVWNAGGHGGHTISTGGPLLGSPIPPIEGHPNDYGQADDSLVISATDTSGSKITAAGRCGFAMDVEQLITSPNSHAVSVASVFEVWDMTAPTAPVLSMRDEFLRVAPVLGEAMVDRFGTAGRNVASDWTCDQASIATTGNYLKRNTSSESAESPATVAGGKAITLDGSLDYLQLQNAHKTYPQPPVAIEQEVAIACWGKLTSSAVTPRILYSGLLLSGTPWSGFQFRITVNGVSSRLALLGGHDALAETVQSPVFDIAPYVNAVWCYVVTFKANANPATGEGRVRFYAGRLGAATLLGEVTTTTAFRPQWASSGTHGFGATSAGVAPFAGTLDELHVFFRELTAEQVAHVCNANADPADFEAMGLVAGWHLDTLTDLGGADGKRWAPWFAGAAGGISADTADWLREKNTITVADPGLVPVTPAGGFLAFSQRPADSPVVQSRTISYRPASAVSVAGLVLRAAPTGTKAIFNGYRLDVAPGTPARVVLYRVLAGVEHVMAEQDPVSGTVNVSSAAFVTVGLAVAQQALGGATGPVVLTASVGGVLVPMISLDAGVVLIDLDGHVVDVSQDRILSGPAEGFHGFVDGLANRFDDWALGVSDAAPDPSTFDPYPVPAEDDGVAGDLALVLTPAWEVEVSYPSPVLITPFDSGHGERRVLEGYVHRSFLCRLIGGSNAEISALRTFWDDHKGGVIPFEWDPSAFLEGQVAGVFRFHDDALADGWRGNRRVTSFTLDECRAS